MPEQPPSASVAYDPVRGHPCWNYGETLDGPPTAEQIERHKCCWCMGTVNATVCHANGHAEAVARQMAPTAPKTPDLMTGPALDLAASAPDLAVDAAGTTRPAS